MKKTTLKKKLSALFLCLLAFVGISQAQTTYTFANYAAGTQYAENEEHVLDNNVTIYTTQCHFTTQLRVYSSDSHNGYFQTNALPLYIESLGFNMGNKVDSVAIYGSTNGLDWSRVGTIHVTQTTYNDYSISFGESNYNFFKFDVIGTQQIRVASMTITYKSTGPGLTAQMPTFSQPSGIFTENFDLSLTCGTPASAIYYTLDGTLPDNNSTLYDSPIALSQTTTVKAIAYADGYNQSPIASNTYYFPVDMANIAEFKTQSASSQPYNIYNATVIYQHGAYNYVKDASGALLVYSNNFGNYNEGDVIPAITGTFTLFSGQIEMSPSWAPEAASSNSGLVEPIVVTMSELLSNYAQYDAQLVTIQDITLPDGFDPAITSTNISQGNSSMVIYNQFGIDTTLAAGTVTDVTGMVAIHNSSIQIEPRTNADLLPTTVVVPTVATPTINPTAGTYADSVVVSLACDSPYTAIRYTLDGSEPSNESTLYTAPFTLTANATVKAKAFNTDWNDSETATAEFVIAHEPALAVSETELTFSSTQLTQTFNITTAFLTDSIALTCDNTHFTLSESTLPANTTAVTVTVTFDGLEATTGTVNVNSGNLNAQVALSATAILPTPVISATTDSVNNTITVNISCTNNDAAIYYTTDGTTPDANATEYTSPFVLSTPGTYTVNAIAMHNNWENSSMATETFTVHEPAIVPTVIDTLAYFTGFEPSEGFTLGSQYNNTTEILNGATNQWATVYGTVSTTAAISDSASMQMRWYTNSASTLGYTRTNFDVSHATRMTFQAKNSNGLNLLVSYSIDGGNNYTDSLFTLTSMAETYELMVSETAEYDNVRFKFAIALPATAPSATSRVYIDNVSIYNFPSIISQTVDMPVISTVSGTIYDTITVDITCATAGADIHYTLDGSTPDANSPLFNGPFDVTTTTTVKAIAMKNGFSNSNVASTSFTFPTAVATIADFKAANTTTNTNPFKITGDVTFVYKNGKNIYIQDASGSLLIYDNNNIITNTYLEGDVISGGIFGTYTLYSGLVEMVPLKNLPAASANTGSIAPIEVDIEAIEAQYSQYESRLVTLANVTFTEGGEFTTSAATNMTIEMNGETMEVRNTFKTLDMTIPAGYQANVTGFVLQYNGNFQIAPRDNNDIVGTAVTTDTVETPEILVDRLTNDMYAVTIECATDNATIYYTTDGTTPDANATPYTSTFTTEGGSTVKAIAIKEGMTNSAIAIYANVGISEIAYNTSLYPNPTSDMVTVACDKAINCIRIYDAFGRLMEMVQVNDNYCALNMSRFAAGTYFLNIDTNDGLLVKKVVRK